MEKNLESSMETVRIYRFRGTFCAKSGPKSRPILFSDCSIGYFKHISKMQVILQAFSLTLNPKPYRRFRGVGSVSLTQDEYRSCMRNTG